MLLLGKEIAQSNLVEGENYFKLSSFVSVNKSSYNFKSGLSCKAPDFNMQCPLEIGASYKVYGAFFAERDSSFVKPDYFNHYFAVDNVVKSAEPANSFGDAYSCRTDKDCDWVNVNCCETRLFCMREDMKFCVEGVSGYPCKGEEPNDVTGRCLCLNGKCSQNSTG